MSAEKKIVLFMVDVFGNGILENECTGRYGLKRGLVRASEI